MINTFHRLKRLRDAEAIDGFTLLEILVVIVVLGILAAVVIFALGSITGQTAVAACQSDGATVSTAIADFNNQNPGTAVTITGLLKGTSANSNNPYIQSWPNNTPHYAFAISTGVNTPGHATAANQLEVSITPAGAVVATALGNYNPYADPTSCAGVS